MKYLVRFLLVVACALFWFFLLMGCSPKPYAETRTYLEHKPRL